MTPAQAVERIRAEALVRGFDVCAFASLQAPWAAAARLARFVELGRHGEMAWMETTRERRSHPSALWPAARSAVMLGLNYGPASDPLAAVGATERGAISVYARGDDYHEVVKGRLKSLGGWMAAGFGGELKVFVDTAPLMEKPLAERSGLGWQGKHTNLVSRRFGSWLLLGSILTTLELPPDDAESDHCGSCDRCLKICPTDAFPAPYQLDARRCVSYLTIEHRGPIPHDLRRGLGNRIYGCDDCLAVCPWNKYAAVAAEIRLKPRPGLEAPALAAMADLDEPSFRRLFARSPVKRTGRSRFVRNVLYAIGNSRLAGLAGVARKRVDDPSPLVRGAAVWALGELLPASAFESLKAALQPAELDAGVQEEWRLSGDRGWPPKP